MKLTVSTALLAISLCIALPATAQVYQWKDENGKTVISDKPPVGQVRDQKKIGTSSPPSSTNGQKQPSLTDREMDFRKRQKEAQESAEKNRKEEASSGEMQENCKNARNQLKSLESGDRISMHDDKGERYYMDDARREQEIEKVRKFVETSCK